MRAVKGIKECSKCGEEKPISEFDKDKSGSGGLSSRCKECRSAYGKKWYTLNTEKQKKQSLEYYYAHRDEVLERGREYGIEYRKNNKEKIAAQHKEYYYNNLEVFRSSHEKNRTKRNEKYRIRYQNDPEYRLGRLIRGRLHHALGREYKKGSAILLLGCSVAGLRQHLESMFKDGMNWNNHGNHGWHIDHVIPLSSFDLMDKEQLKAACNYKNLQPLWAEDNLSKGAKNEIHKKTS